MRNVRGIAVTDDLSDDIGLEAGDDCQDCLFNRDGGALDMSHAEGSSVMSHDLRDRDQRPTP